MRNKIILLFFLIVIVMGCSKEKFDYEDLEIERTEEIEEFEEESEQQYGYIVEQNVIEEEPLEKEEPKKENIVCLYFFHNNKGSPCIKEKEFLFKLQKKYPNLIVKEFITNTRENTKLLYDLAKKYNFNVEFVPITFIGEEVIFGYYDNSTTGNEMEDIIKICENCQCPSLD